MNEAPAATHNDGSHHTPGNSMSGPPRDASLRIIGTHHLELAELNRRKGDGGFNRDPIPGGPEYATGGTMIDAAIMHLDESIPNGQFDRTYHAFQALRAGVQEMAAFLRAKGIPV